MRTILTAIHPDTGQRYKISVVMSDYEIIENPDQPGTCFIDHRMFEDRTYTVENKFYHLHNEANGFHLLPTSN